MRTKLTGASLDALAGAAGLLAALWRLLTFWRYGARADGVLDRWEAMLRTLAVDYAHAYYEDHCTRCQ